MKNDDKKFKIKLVLLWVFAFAVIMFLMSLTANAQGLPVYVDNDEFVAVYGLTADEFIQAVNSSRFAQSNGIVLTLDVPGTFIFNGVENGVNFTEIIIPTSNYIGSFEIANGVTYETWDSEYNYLTLSSDIIYYYLYERDSLQNALLYYYGYGSLNNNNENFYGITNNEIGYLVSDYNWNLDPSYKIATNISIPVLDIGTAIIPPTPLDPSYLNGQTAPLYVPTAPNITSYTWTTPPTFDNSSVINGIQSIKDTLEWLADNIQGSINNLINNIKGLFEYIGQTIQYYGNMIIQTLNNFIQNFYDNMKSLVEPIVSDLNELKQNFLEFADLFIHPFDEEEFEEQMESCELINQYEELMDNCEVLQQIFDYAEERDYFVLYIDFENPFADSEHKIIHSEISFTWLKDYRSSYRPFLWVFTMLECFIGGMRLLGGIIGGKAK